MNYIGSKQRLLPFLHASITQVVQKDLKDCVFCDLFAGTGIVGRSFKPHCKNIISNDLEYYSYILNKNYIANTQPLDYEEHLYFLNQLEGDKGFIFEEYSENGKANRMYFSAYNGAKIDAIRQQIESWNVNREITQELYWFLLASLLESADKVANTASVYGAFLKNIKKTAQQNIVLSPATFVPTSQENTVYQKNSNTLIHEISGDILYLDPPYNARQYGANYHLLNTIGYYDTFIPAGKTGLRQYNKSLYCTSKEVEKQFAELIQAAQFQYIFVSYNNEGLMSPTMIQSILENNGKYSLYTKDYQRFKADKTENRNHVANSTTEYLHVLEK